ncbi:uncharacterized protein LOC111686998 [Lucilia cuprina]|uniref:uncharacterized protein LOC111686998 n=1 Tax=Lucilia cuprina TaxID=7375 RepID=UPI001F06D368|nr:uncharacterized protein LOC111686998 [Lucilia cuprina]
MKCCSRSTLGVIIGVLNVLAYVICTIGAIVFLVQLSGTEKRNQEEIDAAAMYNTIFIVIIVLSLIMIIISALLITGIVKRRHRMMLPWLILSGIGFVVNCIRFVYYFIASIIVGAHFTAIVIILIAGVLGIGISALILWPIYTLYRDMRRENIEKPGHVTDSNPVQYQISSGYYQN